MPTTPPVLTDAGLKGAVVIVTGGGSGTGAADDLTEAYRWLGSQVPLGQIGAPEEVALRITLLLSPMASFMTGAVIPLDGGQVIDRE